MSYTLTTTRDLIKNYFPVPNEVYVLGLKPTEVAIYGYLLRIEDRKTFECYAITRPSAEQWVFLRTRCGSMSGCLRSADSSRRSKRPSRTRTVLNGTVC